MFGIGGIIAVHWITFFGGIALTNVSVALACMATASFFTAILEPLIMPRKFKWYELALGIVVVPGVMLIYRSTDFEFWGILVSLISAFLAALFSILNKKYVTEYDTTAVTFLELGSGWIILSLFLPFFYHFNEPMAFMPHDWDLLWLGLLAFACTSFAFVISLAALRVLSTFVTNLTINLEPVYTIILAFFLFAEHKELDILFYPGAGIIIARPCPTHLGLGSVRDHGSGITGRRHQDLRWRLSRPVLSRWRHRPFTRRLHRRGNPRPARCPRV